MAVFNQQGQSVEYQFNGDTFHFESIRNVPDAIAELERLVAEVNLAGSASKVDPALVAEVQARIREAIAAARQGAPEKSKITSCLNAAKDLLQNVAALSGLASVIENAATTIWRLF